LSSPSVLNMERRELLPVRACTDGQQPGEVAGLEG
jgi:hypothetical protein